MRFTYIRSDKYVSIDGQYYYVEDVSFDPEVDAIQWYETRGEIEFINRQERCNERFEDESYLQPLIDAWNRQKEKELIQKAEEENTLPSLESELIEDNQKLQDKLKNLDVIYVYSHIPKTAGMFLKDLIEKNNDQSKIFDPFTTVTQLAIPVKNAPTVKIIKNFLSATSSSKVKYFMIVRNPYDRIYSMWKWLRIHGIFGDVNFPEVPTDFAEFLKIWKKGGYDSYYFTQSQVNYIEGEDINNISLFKFEDMNSIKEFLTENGVGWSEEKINAVPAPDYKIIYTPELVEIVKEKCAIEFETFGYSTDL